nr:carotenoid oxygenase family protein [Amycolatopsis alba]
MHDRPQDFPRLNSRFSGKSYRFDYSAAAELYAAPSTTEPDRADEGFSSALLKHDLLTGTTKHTSSAVTRARARPCSSRRVGRTLKMTATTWCTSTTPIGARRTW